MRFIFTYFSVFLAFLLLPNPTFADGGKVDVSIKGEADSVWIGDHIAVQYQFTSKSPFKPQFLVDTFRQLGSFEVLTVDVDSAETETGYQYLLNFTLINFEEGQELLPPHFFAFEVDGETQEVRSPPYPYFIKTPEIQAEEDIKPIAPPKSIPFGWRDLLAYWWIFALILLTGALVWWIYHKKQQPKRKLEVPQEKQIPPHEEAYAAIQRLKKEKVWESGEYEVFYVKLSQILRQYLERRYDIQATKSVTKEIIAALGENLDETQQNEVNQLLQKSDLVKFAKFSANEGYRDLQALHDLVKTTAIHHSNEQK